MFNPNISQTLQSFMQRPVTIAPPEKLHAVTGSYADGSGGGVMAWAYDDIDADYMADQFRKSDQFTNIEAIKWQE